MTEFKEPDEQQEEFPIHSIGPELEPQAIANLEQLSNDELRERLEKQNKAIAQYNAGKGPPRGSTEDFDRRRNIAKHISKILEHRTENMPPPGSQEDINREYRQFFPSDPNELARQIASHEQVLREYEAAQESLHTDEALKLSALPIFISSLSNMHHRIIGDIKKRKEVAQELRNVLAERGYEASLDEGKPVARRVLDEAVAQELSSLAGTENGRDQLEELAEQYRKDLAWHDSADHSPAALDRILDAQASIASAHRTDIRQNYELASDDAQRATALQRDRAFKEAAINAIDALLDRID